MFRTTRRIAAVLGVALVTALCIGLALAQANAALEKLLAKALGVAKSNVSVERGATARMKMVEIKGVNEAEIAALFADHEDKT